MKSNTIFFSVFCVILISLWSCNKTEAPNVPDTIPTVDYGVPEDCLGERLGDEGGEEGIYQIKENCAKDYINDYDAYIDSVKAALVDNTSLDTSRLVYGEKVGIHELRVLLHHAELEGYDELYAMIGTIEGQTKIIFTLQDTTEQPKSNLFFDFTMPCPTGCPKGFPYTN